MSKWTPIRGAVTWALPILVVVGQTGWTGWIASASAQDVQSAPPSQQVTAEQSWRESMYCGPNALYFFLKLHGFDRQYADIRKATPVGDQGCSMWDLVETANAQGVKVKVVKLDLAALRKQQLPAVVLMENPSKQFGHFQVVVEVGQDTVTVLDPIWAQTRDIPLGEFQRQWTSYSLIKDNDVRTQWARVIGCCLLALVGVLFACERLFKRRSAPRAVAAAPGPVERPLER
jgi:Peptidase C39 family